MSLTHFHRNVFLTAAASTLALCSAAYAASGDLYTMSNAASGNVVALLKRTEDGALRVSGRFPTGGLGTGVGLVNPVDPLGSQNALTLNANHSWLFAVNAGSNQVSAFRVEDDRLVLTDVVASGGRFPVSIAEKNGLVYVLNAGNDGNVTGFRLTQEGKLRAVPGAARSLHGNVPNVGPFPDILRSAAQIQFSPEGDWLVLTDKQFDTAGTIQRFAVDEDGILSAAPLVTKSPDTVPFGFTFDYRGHLLVTEAVSGTVSSYRMDDRGGLGTLGRAAPNGQMAMCWIDAVRKFAYVSNTNSDTLTGYTVDRTGKLNFIGGKPVLVTLRPGHGPVDVKASSDGRFLNVVHGGTGTVETFRINAADGQLVSRGETQVFPPRSGMEGLASE